VLVEDAEEEEEEEVEEGMCSGVSDVVVVLVLVTAGSSNRRASFSAFHARRCSSRVRSFKPCVSSAWDAGEERCPRG
jgi:hypothetical protein